jgi:hypothetical protein
VAGRKADKAAPTAEAATEAGAEAAPSGGEVTPEPEPVTAAEPATGPPRGGRRYRHRELKLADGGRLVLRTDGTIARFDDAGTRTASWTTDDPEWPGHAIRFGLHPETDTVAPNGSGVRGTRPPS